MKDVFGFTKAINMGALDKASASKKKKVMAILNIKKKRGNIFKLESEKGEAVRIDEYGNKEYMVEGSGGSKWVDRETKEWRNGSLSVFFAGSDRYLFIKKKTKYTFMSLCDQGVKPPNDRYVNFKDTHESTGNIKIRLIEFMKRFPEIPLKGE